MRRIGVVGTRGRTGHLPEEFAVFDHDALQALEEDVYVPNRSERRAHPNRKLTQDELRLLSDAYVRGVDIAGTRRAEEMANAQAARVHREFDKLRKRIHIEFTERDPYQNLEQLAQDVLVNKRMYVYVLHSETPLWDVETNIKARAVHDYDHVIANVDFSPEGELAAFQVAAARAPELEPLYLSEVGLQAASSAVLGGFLPGPQKLVEADPRVARFAREFRRNAPKATKAEREAAAMAVWDVAGALRFMTPEQVMTRLGAEGIPEEDALLLVVAAMDTGA